jgi:hypothetical protein
MNDNLQPLLHKAPLQGLRVNINRAGLCIGDPVELVLMEDGQVGIFARVRKRFLGIIPHQGQAQLGELAPQAARMIAPALHHGQHLRVRIVGLTPEHLSDSAGPEVHISVWGDKARLAEAFPPQFSSGGA